MADQHAFAVLSARIALAVTESVPGTTSYRAAVADAAAAALAAANSDAELARALAIAFSEPVDTP